MNYREKYKRAFNVHDNKIHCESCQRYGEFDVHHIQARGMGGDPNGKRDIIENLMGLCRKCHEWHGDKKERRFYLYESHRQALVSKEVEFDEELMEQLKHGKRL